VRNQAKVELTPSVFIPGVFAQRVPIALYVALNKFNVWMQVHATSAHPEGLQEVVVILQLHTYFQFNILGDGRIVLHEEVRDGYETHTAVGNASNHKMWTVGLNIIVQ
jgi:hypothetical protein